MGQLTKGKKQLGIWHIAVILFLLSVAVRIPLAIFDKTIVIYNDELRFFDIAQSIWESFSIQVQNVPSNFQKILYPVFIAPAFAFKDTQQQLAAIAVINCLLFSSAVFPAIKIAKIATDNKRVLLLVGILTLCLPDLTLTMTFMSECLSFPLMLWAIWYAWYALQQTALRSLCLHSALAGAVCYFLYLSKEMGLGVLLGYLGTCAFLFLFNKPHKKQYALSALLYLGSFALLFVLAKVTLFRGMGDSYGVLQLSSLSSLYRIFYFAYACLVNLVTALLAFFFFPVVYPGTVYKGLKPPQKQLYLLCVISFLAIIAAISFTTSLPDELGNLLPRQHTRYYAPLLVPFLALFFAGIAKKGRQEAGRSIANVPLAVATALYAGLAMGFIKPMPHAVADHSMLNYIGGFFNAVFPYHADGSREVPLYTGMVVLLALVLVGLLCGVLLLHRPAARFKAPAFAAVILAVCMLNSLLGMRIIKDNYSITQAQVHEIEQLKDVADGLQGTLLVLTGEPHDAVENRLLHTYMGTDCYFATALTLHGAQDQQGVLDWQRDGLNRLLNYTFHYVTVAEINSVEYIVAPAGLVQIDAAYAEPVPIEGVTSYTLYKCTNTKETSLVIVE